MRFWDSSAIDPLLVDEAEQKHSPQSECCGYIRCVRRTRYNLLLRSSQRSEIRRL